MARRGMNIYHRKDGRWEGRYLKAKTNGKPRYGYIFAPTYSGAKVKLDAAKSAWETKCEELEREKMTLRAISSRWLEDAKPFLKESTIAKYVDLLQCYILPRFGEMTMDALSTESVQDFLHVLLSHGGAGGQGLSARTVSGIFGILKGIRGYAVKQGYAVGFSTDSLSVRQRQREPRTFSELETSRLRSYLRSHWTACNAGILLCLETGLRLGEICALRWEDISLAERKLHIRQTAQRIRGDGEARTRIVVTPPKSDSSARVIPLPESLCGILSRLKKSNGFLLTGDEERIMEPRTMQRRFKRVLEACGIADANFHALRHTFATRGVEAGFDTKCLSSILGHSNIAMTLNRYVHPTMEMKRRNMAKLL